MFFLFWANNWITVSASFAFGIGVWWPFSLLNFPCGIFTPIPLHLIGQWHPGQTRPHNNEGRPDTLNLSLTGAEQIPQPLTWNHVWLFNRDPRQLCRLTYDLSFVSFKVTFYLIYEGRKNMEITLPIWWLTNTL